VTIEETANKEVSMAAFFPRAFLSGTAALAALVLFASGQAPAQSLPMARVVVAGEGSVNVAPDYARITGGVTTRGKTVKEANDANAKLMSAVAAALLDSGIPQKDIQTAQFSVQPVYVSQGANTEQRLSGFSASNQVLVTIRPIAKVGEVLDRMVAAGATDVGNVSFLVSDPSKALDQAREAAITDAKRRAELYARAAGLTLGRVSWITEESGAAEFTPIRTLKAPVVRAASVPISAGEDELHVQVTVGFDVETK
jgi:uncharacterized protein